MSIYLFIGGFVMTKKDLKDYYKDIREIEKLQERVKKLKKLRQEIIDNMNNGNITLEADIQAISYNNASISKTGICVSQQERAIEKAYQALDNKQSDLYVEIIETETLISDLQLKNLDIDYFLKNLDYEDLKLIELYFRDKKTALQISFILNMHASTVARRINKIIEEYSEIYD